MSRSLHCREHFSLLGGTPWRGGKGSCPTRCPHLPLAAWWACDPTGQWNPFSKLVESHLGGTEGGRRKAPFPGSAPKHVHPPSWGRPPPHSCPQESLPPHLTCSFLTTSLLPCHFHNTIPFYSPDQANFFPPQGMCGLLFPSTWNIQLQTFLCTTGFLSSFQPPSEEYFQGGPAKIAH